MQKFISTAFLILICFTLSSQNYFRIEAEISIKTKLSDGTSTLTMGKTYFDKNLQKLVYSIAFPEKEVWIIKDSLVYTIVNNQLVNKEVIIPMVQYTLFHLALEGKLANFGLKNSIYTAKKVETNDDLVITTWEVPDKLKEKAGQIITSTKHKDLYGVVLFDPNDSILSKQLYKNYQNIKGIRFPAEIIHVMYSDGKESYQLITFKNIRINSLQNENFYNYPIPSE